MYLTRLYLKNLISYFFYCFISLGCSAAAVAQANEVKPRIEFFSIPNSSINSEEISDIKIDRDGYVWVVSLKGLYRFDGQRFQKISTNYNSFGSLIRFYEGNQGEKFVLDYWGAIYFIRNDSMFPYQQNSTIRALYQSYGYSDVSYKDEAYRFSYNSSAYKIVKDGKVKNPLAEKGVDFGGYAVRLREGVFPFMFTGSIAKKLNSESTTFYLFDEELKAIDSCLITLKKQSNPTAIVKLADCSYLYSSGKSELVHFNQNKVIDTIDYPDQVLQLFVDKQNNLWVSARNEGIHYYANSDLSVDNRKGFLPNSTSIVSAQDYQGGIWLYSQGKGLGYISHPTIQFISTKSNARPLVETLVSSGTELYYGDGNKLKVVRNGTTLNVQELLQTDRQMMRLDYDEARERLWLSSRRELCYYEEGKLKKLRNHNRDLHGNFSYLNSDWTDSSISLIGTNGYQYFVCKNDSISYISKRYEQKLKGVLLWRDTFYINSGNGIYVETPDTSYYLGARYKIAQNIDS